MPEAVHALFQQRIAGDDALLRLAGLRFAQMGVGRIGKPLHLHLHDGHPLVPGLHDHFSFLMRLPIPFTYQGRQSLSTMYGPAGLAAIVSAASEASPTRAVSFTLEVHQVEGRLPWPTRRGSSATGGTPPTPNG